jgi:hypothetical protein
LGLSWLRSYGSWIYNYMCNQCLSPLKLWVRTLCMARCAVEVIWPYSMEITQGIYVWYKVVQRRQGQIKIRVGYGVEHWSCEFEPRSWRSVFDTTLCDKACQWLTTGRCFSPVSSVNKTDHHDITEILFKVALNTIILTLQFVRLIVY